MVIIMKLQRRMKRSTKQYITVALICIIVIGGAAVFTSFIITGQIKEEYQTLLDKAHDEMALQQRNVYVAVQDILPGETIDQDMVEKKTVYSSQPEAIFITDDELGKTALVSIPTGTQVLSSMLTERGVSSKLRETEYDVIVLNSNIALNDTVDVRIFYPNGESYVVLAKKEIKGLIPETYGIYFWLEEEELLRMSAAIVDAGLYAGSKLYVTKYIEPNIQEASVINYTPSLSILTLIENDPNIVERCSQELNKDIRKALENRLADSLGIDVSTINWEMDSNISNISGKVNADTLEEESGKEEIGEKELGDAEIGEADAAANKSDTEPEAGRAGNPNEATEMELGSTDYFYYTQEETIKDGEIEYGE